MLINLRNALMAGKRLPYDAEVEYLESTGTQYIDTGVILDSTYGIDISFAPMEGLPGTGINERGIFGSSTSGSVHNVLQIHTSSGGVGLWMPRSTRIAVCPITTELGILQHWQINLANSGSVLINGTASGSTRPATSTACPYPVYLFARDVANSVKNNSYSKMRLYSWTVTDASGNVIQQVIPVRKGTVGYLYDRVSGKLFGNAGTGDFVLGPDRN